VGRQAVAKLGAELLSSTSHVRARLNHEMASEKEVRVPFPAPHEDYRPMARARLASQRGQQRTDMEPMVLSWTVWQLLELLEKATDGAAGGKERVTLTATQREKLEYVRRVANVLETRLMHLDQLLLLLHDA